MLSLRDDAMAIWRAGVAAVDSARLVQNVVTIPGDDLGLAGEQYRLADIDRIIVVGGGKAGAGMAAGFEAALSPPWRARVTGWLNVPADCVRPLAQIHLHPGRPAGLNEPTAAGVTGTAEILKLVAGMTPRDLCVVLLSGGGSALLPAPVDGITLADKQQITRGLMAAGATIDESRIKAGGLLRAMAAGRTVALIISDVIDDPLAVIASGPTVNQPCNPQRALSLLRHYLPSDAIPPSIVLHLERIAAVDDPTAPTIPCRNVIIGNNQTALVAARQAASERGYEVVISAMNQQGIARDVGADFATRLQSLPACDPNSRGWCLLSGGEPVVKLTPTTQPRRGGRNQELVLAAAAAQWSAGPPDWVLLSGGTDGEDGPTDAAGAVFDAAVYHAAITQQLHPAPYLDINNAYPFFAATHGLLITGPTHTNVMDLRIGMKVEG
jgi:glycerate 2-kinase